MIHAVAVLPKRPGAADFLAVGASVIHGIEPVFMAANDDLSLQIRSQRRAAGEIKNLPPGRRCLG